MTSAKKPGRSQNAIRTSDPSAKNKDTDAAGKPDATHVPNEDRHHRISVAAYYRAKRRGFAAGHEQNDWLEAEQEIGGEPSERPYPPEKQQLPRSQMT